MRLSLFAALTAICIAAPTHSQSAGSSITLKQAQTESPNLLARRILGAAGEVYREVQRPFLGGLPGRTSFSLTFATAPRSAGFPGLCEADTIDVALWPREAKGPLSPHRPMIVHSIHTGHAYKIVGDTSPIPKGWTAEYGRKLDALCAESGPVLESLNADTDDPRFFTGTINGSRDFWAAHASFAARVLQAAIADAENRKLLIGKCDDFAEAAFCRDPRRLVASLATSSLRGFEIDNCEEGKPQLCVEAIFNHARSPKGRFRYVSITLGTDAFRDDPMPTNFTIKSAEIEAGEPVY